MSYYSNLVETNVFSIDDTSNLDADIYEYIKKHVFNSKENNELITKDVIKFVGNKAAFNEAKRFLDMTDQELLVYIMRYFNTYATVRYHTLTLAKHLSKHLTVE